MVDIKWPEDVGSAKIVGRVGHLLADNYDEDRDPNIKAAVEGQVTVTPSVEKVKYNGQDGTMLLYTHPVTGVINNEGYLFTKNSSGGVGEAGLVIPASDSPVLQPYGYTYHIRIRVPGEKDLEFNVGVKPGEILDLVKATPVGDKPGTIEIVDRETAIRAEEAQRKAEEAKEGTDRNLTAVEKLAANAKVSEQNSKESETKSATSETNAASSAKVSKNHADRSEKAKSDTLDVWSEIIDTVARGGSFFIQDDPPAAGATYGWTDQDNGRYSVKWVDGKIVSENRVLSPRVLQSPPQAFNRVGVTQSPHHLENTVTVLGGSSDAWVRFHDEPITAAGFVAAGFSLDWIDGIDRAMLSIQFKDSGGSNVAVKDRAVTKADFPYGTRIIEALAVPQPAASVSVYVLLYNTTTGGSPAQGDSIHIGEFSSSMDETENGALAQVEVYFDGDTPDELDDITWVNRELELRYWVDGQWVLRS